jgi:hypothetical protein
MVDLPSHTLLSSLQKVADHAKEYLADVCCRFYDTEVWIHQGTDGDTSEIDLR